MRKRTVWALLAAVTLALLSGSQAPAKSDKEAPPNVRTHYVEMVCRDVAEQCAVLERVLGLSFGSAVPDLGNARVAAGPNGSMIGVRAPLAEHEQPIVRTYLEVEDIKRAVKEAEAAGAVIAYPPTQQGDTGTWAIYILGDLQIGLWQQ